MAFLELCIVVIKCICSSRGDKPDEVYLIEIVGHYEGIPMGAGVVVC